MGQVRRICPGKGRGGEGGRKQVWSTPVSRRGGQKLGRGSRYEPVPKGGSELSRDCRLYRQNEGTQLKDCRQKWLDQFWWFKENSGAVWRWIGGKEWMSGGQPGVHVKENSALVLDGDAEGKMRMFLRYLGDSIHRLRDD